MGNILKNAKFGDKFLTRDGRVAILVHAPSLPEETIYMLAVDDKDMHSVCINAFVNGTAQKAYFSEKDDIVSRYKEPIDKNKLDELAWYEAFKKYDIHSETENIIQHRDGFVEGFKVGYRKAKEE